MHSLLGSRLTRWTAVHVSFICMALIFGSLMQIPGVLIEEARGPRSLAWFSGFLYLWIMIAFAISYFRLQRYLGIPVFGSLVIGTIILLYADTVGSSSLHLFGSGLVLFCPPGFLIAGALSNAGPWRRIFDWTGYQVSS